MQLALQRLCSYLMKAWRKPGEPKLQVKMTNTGIPHQEKETQSPILFVILLIFQARARLKHHLFHIALLGKHQSWQQQHR